MGIIGARQMKFHRWLQRQVTLMDYELIADRFNLSPRSVQGIAQGRRNNVKVLLALFEAARFNLELEYKQMLAWADRVERINEIHFSTRAQMGYEEEKDEDENENKNEVK